MSTPTDDPAAAIRTRITDQYAHIMESLRIHEHEAAEDHWREIGELIKDHRRIARNTPKPL